MTTRTLPARVHTRRSDSDSEGETTPFPSGDFVSTPSETLHSNRAPRPEYTEPQRFARAYVERLVEEYVAAAMHHVRTRQFPDGYWIADVVGLDGAWSDGKTAEDAITALPDILFDWVMLKIADRDGDIPPLAGINLNYL